MINDIGITCIRFCTGYHFKQIKLKNADMWFAFGSSLLTREDLMFQPGSAGLVCPAAACWTSVRASLLSAGTQVDFTWGPDMPPGTSPFTVARLAHLVFQLISHHF